ncbi:MAG TPA: hypothetical protein VM680_19930 [Verrucomicrobiae bacterium]|nr:hypothetical protein [Verrucomicrobiae bacterium]
MNAIIENNTRLANASPALVQAFAPAERLPLDSGNNPSGQICLANEARFTSSFASEPLTNYATGWTDMNNIEKTLDFLFPPVQAPRRFEFKKADNAEAFLSEADDQRAIGADFKHVEYKGTTALEKTFNKGLTIRVDLDQVAGMPNWRELYTARLLQRLLRNELRRAVTAVTTAATNTAKTWDTTNGKDPDQDVLNEIVTASDASGVRPNRILYGDGAWTKRLLSHRAQSTAGGYGSEGFNFAELASWFGLDRVMTSRERWQNTSTTKTKVLSDMVLLFFAEDGLTMDDPSNTKRFWTPVEGGGKYRVYEQPVSSKLVDLTVEHYSNVVVTSSTGLRTLTIS